VKILLATLLLAAIEAEPIPDLKPPRPALEKVRESSRWMWITAGAAAACALIAIALVLSKRKPQSSPSPFERAAADLRSSTPRTAAEVAAVFRHYVAEVLQGAGLARTPDELCASLANYPNWTPDHTTRFRQLFDPVEIAKFAPVPMPPGDPFVAGTLALIEDVEKFRQWTPEQPQ
jgi:hypothetical protein